MMVLMAAKVGEKGPLNHYDRPEFKWRSSSLSGIGSDLFFDVCNIKPRFCIMLNEWEGQRLTFTSD
jgi:hypothetical protein